MMCSVLLEHASHTHTGGPPKEQTLAAGHYRRTDRGHRERQEAERTQIIQTNPKGNTGEGNGKDARSTGRRRANAKSRQSACERPEQRAAESNEES